MLKFQTFLEGKQKEYSCVMLDVPENIPREIKKWKENNIAKDIVVKEEKDLHITALWGLHSDSPDQIRPFLNGSIPISLGVISHFESTKEDILKIDVISPELIKFNKTLSKNLKNTQTHSDYHPHITLAYIKKNSGKELIKNKFFNGIKFFAETIIFVDSKDKTTRIKL